jgi:hypothetical protein
MEVYTGGARFWSGKRKVAEKTSTSVLTPVTDALIVDRKFRGRVARVPSGRLERQSMSVEADEV